MFDPSEERPIPLSKAARLPLMPMRDDKPPHPTTLLRWCLHGIRGVKLESMNCGGMRCTSEQSIRRFFERLSTPFANTTTPTPSQRRKSIERAEKVLQLAGI
jgi:hypothetical protein